MSQEKIPSPGNFYSPKFKSSGFLMLIFASVTPINKDARLIQSDRLAL